MICAVSMHIRGSAGLGVIFLKHFCSLLKKLTKFLSHEHLWIGLCKTLSFLQHYKTTGDYYPEEKL